MTSAMAYGVTDAFIGVKKSKREADVRPLGRGTALRREELVAGPRPPGDRPPRSPSTRTSARSRPVKASLESAQDTRIRQHQARWARAVQLMTALRTVASTSTTRSIAENKPARRAVREGQAAAARARAARLFWHQGRPADRRPLCHEPSRALLLPARTIAIMFSRLPRRRAPQEHAKRLAAKLTEGNARAHIPSFDFSRRPKAEGLMPNPEDFKSRGFPVPPRRPPPPVTIRERIKRAVGSPQRVSPLR